MALGTVPPNATGLLPLVYAVDEDIAVRAAGDYMVIGPDWQQLVYGTDGSFASGDRWTLNSSAADFAAAGLQRGHVLLLSKPATAYRGQGQLFAVEAAMTGSVLLRRLKQPPGVGQPACPPGGLAGVEFKCITFGPQIDEASFAINNRFGIDPNVAGRTAVDAYDLRVLRRATVLMVLFDRYSGEARSPEGDFARKYWQIKNDLTEALAQCHLRWGQAGRSQPSSNMWSSRITR